jgi:type VI secretion system protein ImpK
MSDEIYWPCAHALILATQLPTANGLPAPQDLRQRVMDVLDRMVAAARAANVPEADIVEARYALVAFIDEQILKSAWPGRVEWMNQPLQLVLYREFTAGENFFARMRALLNGSGREMPLEIYYLCLALGFRGAYGVSGNASTLATFADAARERLTKRLPASGKISPHAEPRDRGQKKRADSRFLVILLAACALIVLVTVGARQWLLHSTIEQAVETVVAKGRSPGPTPTPPSTPSPGH